MLAQQCPAPLVSRFVAVVSALLVGLVLHVVSNAWAETQAEHAYLTGCGSDRETEECRLDQAHLNGLLAKGDAEAQYIRSFQERTTGGSGHRQLLGASAAAGYKWAQFDLAIELLRQHKEQGDPGTDAEAVALLRGAAKQGLTSATSILLYRNIAKAPFAPFPNGFDIDAAHRLVQGVSWKDAIGPYLSGRIWFIWASRLRTQDDAMAREALKHAIIACLVLPKYGWLQSAYDCGAILHKLKGAPSRAQILPFFLKIAQKMGHPRAGPLLLQFYKEEKGRFRWHERDFAASELWFRSASLKPKSFFRFARAWCQRRHPAFSRCYYTMAEAHFFCLYPISEIVESYAMTAEYDACMELRFKQRDARMLSLSTRIEP